MRPAGWLDRYRHGEREQVWHEFRRLGDRIREPALAAVATSVCDEMARRARHNVELIVRRLEAQGYRFHTNDADQHPVTPFHPAGPSSVAVSEWLAQQVGPVPLTVSAWLRVVGDVWLVGTHPDWPASASADPLVMELEGARYQDFSITDHFASAWDEWEEWPTDDRAAGMFVLPTAPDRLHKANISGGPPYGFRLPDRCVDGIFVGDAPMPFVDYLNHVFRHGGFPGAAPGDAQWRIKQLLSRDLLPL